MRRKVSADIAGRAGTAVDDDVLSRHFRHPGADNAHYVVHAAAGRERNDHAHRMTRERLGLGKRRSTGNGAGRHQKNYQGCSCRHASSGSRQTARARADSEFFRVLVLEHNPPPAKIPVNATRMSAKLPSQMKAVEISQPGGPEVLKPASRPVPTPGPGEVLIKVAAAGVNGPDLMQRKGLYPAPPGASDLPGLEISGVVAAVGDKVKRWSVGNEVTALTNGGGYAEYCTVDATHCLPVPKGV